MDATFFDLRKQPKKILSAIERNESVTLTYRGHKKAIIVPCSSSRKRPSISQCPATGMWDDREDMENVDSFVRNLRKGRSF